MRKIFLLLFLPATLLSQFNAGMQVKEESANARNWIGFGQAMSFGGKKFEIGVVNHFLRSIPLDEGNPQDVWKFQSQGYLRLRNLRPLTSFVQIENEITENFKLKFGVGLLGKIKVYQFETGVFYEPASRIFFFRIAAAVREKDDRLYHLKKMR